MSNTKGLAELMEQLQKLPSVGEKTAQRFALFIIKQPIEFAQDLSSAIIKCRQQLKFCKICANFAEADLCDICSNPKRDPEIICIVAETKDLIAIERTNSFNGLYHVLFGLISPMEGKGPNDIKLKELLIRLQSEPVKELVLAIPSSVEGEATSLYIKKLIPSITKVNITRIAFGLSVGTELEFADITSLSKSIEERKNF